MCAFEISATHLQGFGGYKALSHALACLAPHHYCEDIKTRELWFTGKVIGRTMVDRGP